MASESSSETIVSLQRLLELVWFFFFFSYPEDKPADSYLEGMIKRVETFSLIEPLDVRETEYREFITFCD